MTKLAHKKRTIIDIRLSPELAEVWEALNRITPEQLLGEGRVCGGGLHKLEPKGLANVPAQDIDALLPAADRPMLQKDLFAAEVAA
jgi:hypothetical protein